MIWNSIVTKLWIAITMLVLLVIGIAGAAQTNFLDKIYYQQQSNYLIALGNKVVDLARAEKDSKVLDIKVKTVANTINGNVMVIDRKNTVRFCHGMGFSTQNMPMDINNPHHGPLTQADLNKLYSGETVVRKGQNAFFKTEVLSIAIPVKAPENTAKAIMIHAPLKPLAGQLAIFKKITVYTAIGGIILATILSMIFSRMISRPLLNMNRVALAMASGDFSRQVKVNTNDEISLLANSLNTLSSRLQEKLAQLEGLEQTRREFVANVSHEIKTPLSIMQAFTEALQDGLAADENERQAYLKNISDEIERLRRLVNDVLDLKKMEEGHDDFERNYVDLKTVTAVVQSKFSTIAQDSGVNLRFKIDKKTPSIYGNQDRIEQVFINLIDNAIRNTPKGGKVLVKAYLKADKVMIEISDTGTGIPQEDLPMIWERFYKADKSRTRGQKSGTGLGLAIVKQIIEAHGGNINVQCKPSEGTTFSIILPTNKETLLQKR